jgi:hypothetical protein
MRNNSKHNHKLRGLFWSVVILVELSSVAAVVAKRGGRTPSTSITINNNSSSLEIRRVYLSHTDKDDWGGDQLGEIPIAPGKSTTLNDVSCDQAEIKVIGEDQNGCFLYQIVACGGNSTWTITNGAMPDCGN